MLVEALSGRRPRDWDPALLAIMERSPDEVFARLCLDEAAIDRGEIEAAGKHIDAAVALRSEKWTAADAILFTEAAYYAARHRGDARAARGAPRSRRRRGRGGLPPRQGRGRRAVRRGSWTRRQAARVAGLRPCERARRKDGDPCREQLEDLARGRGCTGRGRLLTRSALAAALEPASELSISRPRRGSGSKPCGAYVMVALVLELGAGPSGNWDRGGTAPGPALGQSAARCWHPERPSSRESRWVLLGLQKAAAPRPAAALHRRQTPGFVADRRRRHGWCAHRANRSTPSTGAVRIVPRRVCLPLRKPSASNRRRSVPRSSSRPRPRSDVDPRAPCRRSAPLAPHALERVRRSWARSPRGTAPAARGAAVACPRARRRSFPGLEHARR